MFSPLDGQPCADHDRASGEGVGPQEYTLIKMEALELNGGTLADGMAGVRMLMLMADLPSPPTGKLQALQGQGRVFLMAATLRPETMYGQTNCWVLPEGKYGAYRGLEGEVYILTERSALNLSYQVRFCNAV